MVTRRISAIEVARRSAEGRGQTRNSLGPETGSSLSLTRCNGSPCFRPDCPGSAANIIPEEEDNVN